MHMNKMGDMAAACAVPFSAQCTVDRVFTTLPVYLGMMLHNSTRKKSAPLIYIFLTLVRYQIFYITLHYR